MLQEDNGKYSSKRVLGTIIIMSMLFLFIFKEIKGDEIMSMEVFISFLVTAGTLLGITVIKPDNKKI